MNLFLIQFAACILLAMGFTGYYLRPSYAVAAVLVTLAMVL